MNSAICNSIINELPRDKYGALKMSEVLSSELQVQVKALLDEAINAGHLPAAFISRGKKEFECLNLDIYDVLVFRGRVKSLIVQARSFWKHLQKGYTRSGKDYHLVTRCGRKTTVSDVDKATCAKRAKNTTSFGQLVKHYLGISVVACKKPNIPVLNAYEELVRTSDGQLVSAVDGSAYKKGESCSYLIKPGPYGPGVCYYICKKFAVDNTKSWNKFAASVAPGK